MTMKRVGVSVAIAAAILIAEYFVGNWVGFLFDDSSMLSIMMSMLPDQEDEDNDEVEYINVAYDKELVDVRVQNMNSARGWDSIGSAVGTSRQTLLKILDIAEKSNYRYLFLDVRFEKGFESEMDSILFAKIKSMRNVVVSTHKESDDYEIADRSLLKHAGYADYMTTYFSGFTKYSYLQNDSISVALKMFGDMDGGDIKRVGPFFFSNGRLCNNLQFLTFSSDDINLRHPAFEGETLKIYDEKDIAERMNGRIVVVGDMVNDVHTTYAGRVAGPVLNVRAYQALAKGRHIVDWRLVLFLLAVYGVCAYLILYSGSLEIPERLRKKLLHHPLIVFILLNFGWSIVMFIIKLVVFRKFGASVIIIIPAFIFSLLSMPKEYAEFKKNRNIFSESKSKADEDTQDITTISENTPTSYE
ncbi:MAG: hypothetical protein K2N48_02465 [Muribaculaceae bacterium]|nr:hypothetical protein [Muribaculaceae bacterium]